MSINPDRNNISGSRRSRSIEGDGYDEGRNVRAAILRPSRQHSLTSEMIHEIANEHGIDPQIAGRMSLGEHLTLRDGTDDARRRIIERARQESINRNVDEEVINNMHVLGHSERQAQPNQNLHRGRRPIQVRPLNEDEIHFWRQQIPLRNDRSRFYPFEANGRSNSNIEDHCSVCLEDIDPLVGNHVKAPCGHRFHVHCLNEWAQREFLANRTVRCPICRSIDVEKLTRIPELVVRRP